MADDDPSFGSLGVSKWLQAQCREVGITAPTPVQASCIPPVLAGRDCVGISKTGSGKTMAFAIPILQTLSEDPYGVYALVLTPTRELAYQIADQFRVLGKPLNLRDCVVVGGRDNVLQSLDLDKRPHVVIATPGRLADHVRNNSTFSLKKIKYLVLDEADRLLEGGFDQQLSEIFPALPTKRQTLLFTATTSDVIRQTMAACPNNPFVWESTGPDQETTVETLDQRFVLTPKEARDGYLAELVSTTRDNSPTDSVIIFTRTCRGCEIISRTLTKLGIPAAGLHSMKPQKERMSALSRFKSNQVKVLVATDVASRGLDIPQVQLVVNHNVPTVPKDYVHRVGRTARAGRAGRSVTLVTPHDIGLVHAIEELVNNKMVEMEMDEERVALILTQVNVTMREVEISLGEEDWDEKRNINKRKKLLLEGRDPDEEERKKQKLWKEKIKSKRKERRKKKNVFTISNSKKS